MATEKKYEKRWKLTQKTFYFLISKKKGKNGPGGNSQNPLTSGVTMLRWVTRAGTDMMWMRNGRIRLSENCAAITGLETDRSPYSDRFACEPGVEEQPY